jgi:RNA polymerase sigma-70 factor (ECF subfamily)
LQKKQLFLEISKGSHEAFAHFFEIYEKRMYGFLYKMFRSREEVEELMQIVFVKVWENRATINHELSPNAYVFKIARNCALNMLRQKAYKLLLEKQLIENSNIIEDGETPLIDEDLKRHIESLVTNIPERRREIFKLRYEKDLSYKEIAEQLSISENTVNTQISLALNYLRKELGKELWAVAFPLIIFFSVLKI